MAMRARKALAATGLGLWIVVPIAAMAFFFQTGAQQQIAPPEETWVPVSAGGALGSTTVDLSLVWSLPSPTVAPAWQGIVQKTHLAAGSPIADGKAIVKIDGIDRLGFVSSVPFARTLAAGDRGEDVSELNRLLGLLKFPHNEGDGFGALTRQGVLSLADAIGAPVQSAFDPGWVIYLAGPGMVAEQVKFTVGAPAPAPGTEIIQPKKLLTAAYLLAPGSTPPAAAAGLNVPGSPEQPAAAPTAVPAVQKFPAPGGASLHVGKQELKLTDTRDAIAPADLHLLEAQLATGATTTTARLDRPSGQNEFSVPAAAMITGSSGSTCVLKSPGGGGPSAVVPVEVIGDAQGRVSVTGDLGIGDRVQTSVKSEDRKCG